MHRNWEQGNSSSTLSSSSEFPPLPTVDRSPLNICPNLSNTNAADSSGEEIIVTKEIGSFDIFNNPIHFLAFLAEVIQQTIVAKDRNESIDVFKIVTGAAGGRIDLPLDAEQIKLISK